LGGHVVLALSSILSRNVTVTRLSHSFLRWYVPVGAFDERTQHEVSDRIQKILNFEFQITEPFLHHQRKCQRNTTTLNKTDDDEEAAVDWQE
jgi:hypothetical protein